MSEERLQEIKDSISLQYKVQEANDLNNFNIFTDEEQELVDEIERLKNIIKEVREILKYHLSNPSGTKNGWHIDIWNSENINKLNELLEILDKVGDEK